MAVETFLQPKSIVVVGEMAAQYAPHEQETPDMTVRVDAGRVFDTSAKTVTDVAAQSTAAITAPTSNPRNDIIYIDLVTAAVGVATGTEAASPVDPAIPDDKAPVARINLTTSTTTITNADLDDLRISSVGIPGGSGTGVAGPAENAMLNRLEIANQHTLTAGNLVDGMFDAFTDELGVDAATSLNEAYDAAGDFYESAPSGTFGADQTTTGGAIADSVYQGTFTADRAYDDDDATQWGSVNVAPTIAGLAWCGQDFGVGVTKNIRRVAVQQNQPLSGNRLFGTDAIKVQSSDDNAVWTDVDTLSPIDNQLLQVFDIANGGSHRYWRFLANKELTGISGSAWAIFEAEMREPAATIDMTLVSNSFTAQSQPDSVDVAILWEEIDAVTLNTDLLLDVSRDGGTTFTAGTLATRGYYTPTQEILTASIDVSGQPVGTAMKWRIRTVNDKSLRVHGVGLTWS